MKRILFTGAVALLMFACGEQKQKESISIDGSSTVFPVTEAIAEEYRSAAPETNITIGVSGTGGGFQKFGRGEIEIVNASRPIKENESALAMENNIAFVELEVAYDGIAVVVNPENDWLDCITVKELEMIWEPAAQGTITRWNQIRPEWPNEEIHLFGPGVASGTFDYFTEAIVGKSGSSRGDYTASEDDNILVQGVAGDKYALGFFGLAFYLENQDKLRLVGVDGGQGCIMPSEETVRTGTYAPLSRPLYIYVSSKAVQKSAVVEFVNFYLEEASGVLNDVGYVPLTEEEYNTEKEKFKTFAEKYKSAEEQQ